MGPKEKSDICLTRENTMKELTKEEKYTRVIDMYSTDVYKICFYLTKDKESARLLSIKVFVDFYDVFESIIDFDSADIENEIKSKRILRYLTGMILKRLEKEQ